LVGAETRSTWWPDLLRGNLLMSRALGHPVVPALALVVAALIALSRYESGEGRNWLWLASTLAFAVPFFKVFLGAHLLLGLIAATLLSSPGRRPAPPALALPCPVSTGLLGLAPAGPTVAVVRAA